MIPSYFNLFRTNNPDELPLEPVAPSTAVDWKLIKSIDPGLMDFENEKILQFVEEFPTYKLSSNDSSIISHPCAIRLFLIMQHCFSAFSHKLKYYIKKAMKQEKEIKLISKKNKEYQKIFESDQNDEKKTKPEKCYACRKRFLTVKDLHIHISKEHPYLIKSWKRIIHNKTEDKDEIIISNLRVDVNNLRQYVFEQEKSYKEMVQKLQLRNQALKQKNKEIRSIQNPQVTATNLNSNFVSTLEVRPKCNPLINTYHQPSLSHSTDNFLINSDDGNSEEDIYIAGENVRQSIQSQADIVLNRKKKKDFRNVRDAIRIHLEHEIPMPVSINNQPLSSSNTVPYIAPLNLNQINNPENVTISIANDENNVDNNVFHLNQTGRSQSFKSTNDPFMLSTTQNRTSTRFMLSATQNDEESMGRTDPFYITDGDQSQRTPRKSTTGNGFVVTMDNSSSRRTKNNVMLITDDDNYYSF